METSLSIGADDDDGNDDEDNALTDASSSVEAGEVPSFSFFLGPLPH
jgi:hypothetical protein